MNLLTNCEFVLHPSRSASYILALLFTLTCQQEGNFHIRVNASTLLDLDDLYFL